MLIIHSSKLVRGVSGTNALILKFVMGRNRKHQPQAPARWILLIKCPPPTQPMKQPSGEKKKLSSSTKVLPSKTKPN